MSKNRKETPVVHLFVNWIHEEDLWEEDYGVVAATVASIGKSLDKLKADGWKLFHGTSEEGPNNRIAFYLATHDSVKTEAEAEKRLAKLKLTATVEIRNEPLGEVDEGEKEVEEIAPRKRPDSEARRMALIPEKVTGRVAIGGTSRKM